MTPRLSVVLPALDEAERIGTTVEALRRELADVASTGGLEIVVVDDGSRDDTAAVARSAGADRALVHGRNFGKGAAVRTGVMGSSGRVVAFTDADLAYAPHHLRTMLEHVEAGSQVVIGSRAHPESTTVVAASRVRAAGSRVINVLSRAVLQEDYRDTQSGLKAFDGEVARRLFGLARVDGMGFDIEVLFLAERLGLSVREIPVEVANSPTSSVRVLRDGLRLVADVARVRWWAGRGAYDERVGAASG